jgi:hypothetical protein
MADKERVHATHTRGLQEGPTQRGRSHESGAGVMVPPEATTRAKAVRIYRYVYAFMARARKNPDFDPVEIRGNETVKANCKDIIKENYGPPSEKYRRAARLLLLQDAQASINKRSLESLALEVKKYKQAGSGEKAIVIVGGRQK